jgi:hypothetical protein
MRLLNRLLAATVVGLALVGCHSNKSYDGPTVDAFNGQLTQGGKPVSFPPGEQVVLKVILQEKGRQFGIPIQSDGTFRIGWMPIGTYSAMLQRPPAGTRGGSKVHVVPKAFSIVNGQTQYSIDLGKAYSP